jgi:hypothetical protein
MRWFRGWATQIGSRVQDSTSAANRDRPAG